MTIFYGNGRFFGEWEDDTYLIFDTRHRKSYWNNLAILIAEFSSEEEAVKYLKSEYPEAFAADE